MHERGGEIKSVFCRLSSLQGLSVWTVLKGLSSPWGSDEPLCVHPWINTLMGSGCVEAVVGRHWGAQTEKEVSMALKASSDCVPQ